MISPFYQYLMNFIKSKISMMAQAYLFERIIKNSFFEDAGNAGNVAFNQVISS